MIEVTTGNLVLIPENLTDDITTFTNIKDTLEQSLGATVVSEDDTLVFTIVNDYKSMIDVHETFMELFEMIPAEAVSHFEALRVNPITFDESVKYTVDDDNSVVMSECYENLLEDGSSWSMFDVLSD